MANNFNKPKLLFCPASGNNRSTRTLGAIGSRGGSGAADEPGYLIGL